MDMRYIVSRRTFPEVFPRLLFRPRGYCLQVMVVVTSIPRINCNLPEVFDFGSQEGEQLQWLGHVSRRRGYGPEKRSVLMNRRWKRTLLMLSNLWIPLLQKLSAEKNGVVPELIWHGLLQNLLI